MPTLVKEIKVKNQNNTYDTAQISTDADLVEFDNTGSNIVATDVESAIKEVNTNIGNKSTVNIVQAQGSSSGVAVGTAVVDGTTVNLYAPVEANPEGSGTATPLTRLKVGSGIYSISGGGGGSEVEVTPVITSTDGVTKIADVSVDGVEADFYASVVKANPTGTSGSNLTRLQIDGTDYNIPVGSEVIANPSGVSSTDLTKISVDGSIYNIPSGGGSGDSVSWNQITQSGTKIAEVTINNTTTNVYAPSGGGGSSTLSGLSDVTITSPINGQIIKYDSTNQIWINANESAGGYIDITGVLTAGSTSITLSDVSITTASTFDFYTDTFGVNPTAITVTNGNITLTFEAQQSNVGVKVRVTTDGTPSGSGNGNVTINSSTIVDISQVI